MSASTTIAHDALLDAIGDGASIETDQWRLGEMVNHLPSQLLILEGGDSWCVRLATFGGGADFDDRAVPCWQ